MSARAAVLATCLRVGGCGEGTKPVPTTSPPEGKAHREHREKLELVASFSFFGNVMSMASVQLAGAKRDALLLSFKDAKVGGGLGGGPGHAVGLVGVLGTRWAVVSRLGGAQWRVEALTCRPQLSVVEYDPGTHDLKTLSLHYFEEPELRVGRLCPTRPAPLPPPVPCPRPPPCFPRGLPLAPWPA